MPNILFVCLGNICRSPAAEAYFRHHVQERGLDHAFCIDSAGTGGWHAGEPADARMRSAAQKRGVEISSHARQIASSDADADLIVVMDKANHKDVTDLPWVEPSRVRCLLEFHPETSRTEVPDPYYDGTKAFDLVLDLVDTATYALLDYLQERELV